jgi:hypothetical protein
MAEPTVTVPVSQVIQDTWPRFLGHWSAVTLGFFLQTALPALNSRAQGIPSSQLDTGKWLAALGAAAGFALVGGGINSNLPVKPRELVKSILLGFALNAAKLLVQHS